LLDWKLLSLASLEDLTEKYGDLVHVLELDVTDKAAVDAAVQGVAEHFGKLDVVVNNAGYGYFGTVEEIGEEEARAQFETNVFGALWVTKAAVPIMRALGSGHLIQVSSISGVNAYPELGVYNATKWALEGLSQSLAAETDWAGSSAQFAEPLEAYQHVRDAGAKNPAVLRPGDPQATAAEILAVVDAEEPPLRCFFGDWALAHTKEEYERRIAVWEQWDEVAAGAQGARFT
jgi:NAD(P)-dependent dehydrogenase (short-subunit alcohol dehydrogenase family)